VALALALPAAGMLLYFFRLQFVSYNQPSDQVLTEYLDPVTLCRTVWSLQCYYVSTQPLAPRMACAAALPPLFAVGLLDLGCSRRHGLGLCVLFFVAAIAHLVYQKHHPYGAYKLFNVSWWCVVAALGAGCEWALRQARRVRARLLVAPGLAL